LNLIPKIFIKHITHRPKLVKILDNISWLFFDKIVRMGVGLLVWVWIARYLGPEQYGLLSFTTAFVSLFSAIALLGLQGIVVRDIVSNPDETPTTLGTAAILQLVGGCVSYVLTLLTIAYLRPDDKIAQTIIAILGSMMLFKMSEIAVYWFESQVQSKYTVWIQNSVFLIFAVVKVIMIIQKATIITLVWTMLFEVVIGSVMMFFVMNKHGLPLLSLRYSSQRAKTLLKDSWPLLLSGIAITIYMKIDQIMMGQIIGDEAVGVYTAATRISEVWYFIPIVIVASVFPAVLEAKKRSDELYYERLQKLYDLMVILSVTVALPMTFLSGSIVTILFGEAFQAAGAVLAIHIWASIFVFLGVASGKWFLAENRQILSFQRAGFGVVVNIALNIWLIPIYGAKGAAVATLISQAMATWFFDLLQTETRFMFVMKLKSMGSNQKVGD
jgi:O-antigen/teichoic acid export membrane protein